MLKQFSLFKLCQPTTCILAQQRRNIIRLGCFAVILYQGNPKPLKRQVHRKKTGFYHVLSKNRGFLNSKISISALSHKVLPLMLKINNVVISMLPVVLCRAGLETLLGNYSYISQMYALQLSIDEMLRQTMSFFAYQEHTQQLELCICKTIFHDEQATRFLMKFVRAKTISGP